MDHRASGAGNEGNTALSDDDLRLDQLALTAPAQ